MTEKTIEGVLSLSGRGVGYVRIKNEKESVEIDHEHLNTGLQGDTVRVELYPKITDMPQKGKITEIIRRSKVGFAGVIEEDRKLFFLVPSDSKMYTDIMIVPDGLNGAKPGQKVFVELVSWTDPHKMPSGRVVEILGMPFENNAEMRAIAMEKGFVSTFPADVERDAQSLYDSTPIDDAEISKRRDMRSIMTCTIDPVDAKDFDDAISYQTFPDGTYELGIHIADVSHYVVPGTALDNEAIKRQTSVYLVDRTIPMLPEVLSNDLCSLKPNVDRLVFSSIFTFSKNHEILTEWYGKAIIHSDKRFTYEEAQAILDAKQGLYFEELTAMNILAKKLHKERMDAGAMSLEQDEVKFILDENGVPLSVYRKVRGDTHKMIEELMLLANRKVAEYIAAKEKETGRDQVFVYRVHDKPDPERVEKLVSFLDKLGYHIETKDGVIPTAAMNDLIEQLEGKEEKETIHTAIIRSSSKAIYSTKNIGHYGLAFKYYTHFTSPIRRYPDVLVHRLMQDYLHGITVPMERWHEYEKFSEMASQREKEASDAERASVKYKQVEYMSSRVGNVYDGVITGITESGIFVEERETKCEGMIRLKDLGGNDFWKYDAEHLTIRGNQSKQTFSVGDKLKIRVVRADMNKKVIDYALVRE